MKTFKRGTSQLHHVPLIALFLVLTTWPCHSQELSGWSLTFQDEFVGVGLVTNKWKTTYPWGGADERTLTGNAEQEVYWDNQFEETDGVLRIRADKVNTQWSGMTYNYSSGLITSYSHFAQQYGYFEMRARTPHGDGLWPAFWMGLDRAYWPPEVDMLETLDNNEEAPHYGVIETAKTNWAEFYPSFNSTVGYHVYGMEWDTNYVTIYLDGQKTWQGRVATNMTEPKQVMANLAVGGVGTIGPDASTVFPAYMDIDYIRIWLRTNSLAPIPTTVGYDIGQVGIAGNAAISTDGTATISGAGSGYWAGESGDNFQYTAEPVAGDRDYDYQAEITSMTVAGGQAGVMIRQTMETNGQYVAVYVSNGNCVLVSRAEADGNTVQIASTSALADPVWLRLVRRGDAISAYQSGDGIAWSYVGATTNDMSSGLLGGSVFAGVAVSSGSMLESNVVDIGSLNKPAIEVIQDNGDKNGGVSINGSWTGATNQAGYYGTNYIVASNGSSWVRYTPDLPTNATYDVYLRWTAFNGRSSQVPVSVTYAGGSTNAVVNQQHQGGQWIWLGAFPFNAGTSGNVQINDTNVSGSVCADAVRYVPGVGRAPMAPTPPDAPTGLAVIASPGTNQITLSWNAAPRATSYNIKRANTNGGPYTTVGVDILPGFTEYTDTNLVAGREYYYVVSAVNNSSPCNPGGQESPDSNEAAGIPSIIVDNLNTNEVSIVGTWTSGNTAPGYYGTNYLHDGNAGGGKSVTFTPNLPVNASYDVFMRWTTGINRATNATAVINYAGGSSTNSVNEQLSDGVWWVYLGTYNFNAGTAGSLTVSDPNASGYVIADAVEFALANPIMLQAAQANGAVRFSVQSEIGRHYQLERSPALIPPAWTNVGIAQAGTGGVLTFSDDPGSSGATEFYRVQVSL